MRKICWFKEFLTTLNNVVYIHRSFCFFSVSRHTHSFNSYDYVYELDTFWSNLNALSSYGVRYIESWPKNTFNPNMFNIRVLVTRKKAYARKEYLLYSLRWTGMEFVIAHWLFVFSNASCFLFLALEAQSTYQKNIKVKKAELLIDIEYLNI